MYRCLRLFISTATIMTCSAGVSADPLLSSAAHNSYYVRERRICKHAYPIFNRSQYSIHRWKNQDTTWKKYISLSKELKKVSCLIDGQHNNTLRVDFLKKSCRGCAFARSKTSIPNFTIENRFIKHDII